MKTSTRRLLLLIFFFSGFSSLIYQIVWQRLLTLYYGVGNVSVSLIVGTFLLGLGLGSLIGGQIADRIKDRVKMYFLVELLLGLFGLGSYWFMDAVASATAGSNYLLTLFMVFLLLSLPTFLMGLTFPLLTRIFNELFQDFFQTVSRLYFVNTLGAAFGALLTSYIFISFWGLDRALFIAAGINLCLAASIFLIRRGVGKMKKEGEEEKENGKGGLGKMAYVLVFLIGFIAIGYEIIGYRILSVILKNSPYVFSTMLAVYLCGIALGSRFVQRLLLKRPQLDRRRLFFTLQGAVGLLVALSCTAFVWLNGHTGFHSLVEISFNSDLHPNPSFPSLDSFFYDSYRLFDVFFWPVIVLFLPAFLLGGSFPLVAALAPGGAGEEGRTIGRVYFWNILGNFLGSLLTGFFLLRFLGTETTLLVFASLNILLFAFRKAGTQKPAQILPRFALPLAAIALAIVLFPGRGKLYASIYPETQLSGEDALIFDEGTEGVVMSYEYEDQLVTYIDGVPHGGRGTEDDYGFAYEAIEALSHVADPKEILIVGFGTGYVTEAANRLSGSPSITVVEINETLLRNLRRTQSAREIMESERINWVIDDARRYLLGTDKRFDAVLIDPLRTSSAYSNNLYSQEFFQLASDRLNPGGVFMMWTDEQRVMPRTLASVYPYIRFYSFFCLSSKSPFSINEGRKRELLSTYRPEEQAILSHFDQRRFYLGDEGYVEAVTEGFPINKDTRPICEYYLGYRFRESLHWGK